MNFFGDKGLTVPGYNYLGPFNSMNKEYRKNKPPVSRLDEIAEYHDILYGRILKDSGSMADAYLKFNGADLWMINQIDKEYHKFNFKDKVMSKLVKAIWNSKRALSSLAVEENMEMWKLVLEKGDEMMPKRHADADERNVRAKIEQDGSEPIFYDFEDWTAYEDSVGDALLNEWYGINPNVDPIELPPPEASMFESTPHHIMHPKYYKVVKGKVVVWKDVFPLPI